ncbi:GNAT family N-acetyltransferase [Nocardia vinacea]|uniref:hypothetical protein n=1 Tax=Nocardia vinacea TaxID=96468 RepID=UPI002E10635B|nr:GNAT family N-acetyltransferase [Nocardia vinacea]
MNELPMLSAVQIAADRVLLRKARDTDRERLIELRTEPEVGAYIGGPRLREDVEQFPRERARGSLQHRRRLDIGPVRRSQHQRARKPQLGQRYAPIHIGQPHR